MLIQSVLPMVDVIRAHGRTVMVHPVRLLDSKFDFIRKIGTHELYTLATAHKIDLKTDKHGNLEHVRLKPGVCIQSVGRLLNPMNAGACKVITKRRQNRGAKKWVPHFDKSECGSVANHKHVVFPLAMAEQYVRVA